MLETVLLATNHIDFQPIISVSYWNIHLNLLFLRRVMRQRRPHVRPPLVMGAPLSVQSTIRAGPQAPQEVTQMTLPAQRPA